VRTDVRFPQESDLNGRVIVIDRDRDQPRKSKSGARNHLAPLFLFHSSERAKRSAIDLEQPGAALPAADAHRDDAHFALRRRPSRKIWPVRRTPAMPWPDCTVRIA
jgi:hypothetical protein